jgi:hypothetical protein
LFGPLALLVLFGTWATGLIVAFAILHWSLQTPMTPGGTSLAPGSYLYFSGVTFFTLGYGDMTPTGTLGRFLAVVETGLGFGFLAVIISYHPVLTQAFSRREIVISLLDARGGSPPTAAQILIRSRNSTPCDALGPDLVVWETWSAELLESELFGHKRGAFTGADADRTGRFELANGGTLSLDEVGEIPLDLQGKLLRVLQEGQFQRVGEDRTRTVDVRLVTATNRELLAEAKAGRFRLDLYYRLSVFPIEIPPLRDRREDIVPLATHFLAQAGRRIGISGLRLSQENVAQLQSYDWPGNVRELQNVIVRAVILARGGKVHFDLGPPAVSIKPGRADDATGRAPDGGAARPASWRELKTQERSLIEQALKQSGGRIYGPNGAAAILGLRPTTLASKIQRMGLRH